MIIVSTPSLHITFQNIYRRKVKPYKVSDKPSSQKIHIPKIETVFIKETTSHHIHPYHSHNKNDSKPVHLKKNTAASRT